MTGGAAPVAAASDDHSPLPTERPPPDPVLPLVLMHLLTVESILPQVAAPEVARIPTMQVPMPGRVPAVPKYRLPVEVPVHPSGLAGGCGLRGHGACTHDQQGRRKGKQ